MAKQELPVDFKDDVLQAAMAGKRRYRVIQNEDGTISLDDVTEYSQIGNSYGAAQMNATNMAVNESFDKNKVIDSLDDIAANESAGYAAGALAVRELNGKISKRIEGVKQTGSGGRIYAQRNGDFIDIDINLSGCLVGNAYTWYNVGYIDISQIGVKSTEAARGQAYFSNQGPAYGDDGGKTTINCIAQSSGRIQLRAQSSKTFSEGRLYVATISVPISD